MWQITYALLARLLAAAIQAAGGAKGPLNGVWLGLYQQGTAPVTPQSVMGSIVEANYHGYSRQVVPWFPPFQSTLGPEAIAAQDLFYTPTDGVVPNLITGAFLADAFYGGTLLAGAIAPGTGVMLATPVNALKIQAQFSMAPGLIYGAPAWVV